MSQSKKSGADTLRETLIAFNGTDSAADILRSMVNWCNNTTESVLDNYSITELIKLYAAFKVCDWDLTLDYWTPRQRWVAVRGIVPQWGEHERDPVYTNPKRFALKAKR